MSSKLVITCNGASGREVTFSYKYADSSTTTQKVKNLCNGLVSNSSIFADPPVSVKGAKLVVTTESDYILSE